MSDGTFSLNFADVEVQDFEPIPSGNYHAAVTDYEVREAGENAKNPGSQYINWEFTIQSGEYEGRKQWNNTSLLPQALFGLKALLLATGSTQEELDGEFNFDPDDLLGKELVIGVGQKVYQGEKRNEVKKFKPLGTLADASDGSLLP